jgi:hypothetical protein
MAIEERTVSAFIERSDPARIKFKIYPGFAAK